MTEKLSLLHACSQVLKKKDYLFIDFFILVVVWTASDECY